MHELIRIWRFDDDAARRDFCKTLFADEAFMALRRADSPVYPDPGRAADACRALRAEAVAAGESA